MKTLWVPRAAPLEVVALGARGEAARVVASRLLERPDDELKRLRGVTWRDGLALEGEFALLPWADGAQYFGRVGGFLLPSNLEPNVPLAIYLRALPRAFPRSVLPPILVWPEPQTVVSLALARPIERAKLEAWMSSLSIEENAGRSG